MDSLVLDISQKRNCTTRGPACLATVFHGYRRGAWALPAGVWGPEGSGAVESVTEGLWRRSGLCVACRVILSCHLRALGERCAPSGPLLPQLLGLAQLLRVTSPRGNGFGPSRHRAAGPFAAARQGLGGCSAGLRGPAGSLGTACGVWCSVFPGWHVCLSDTAAAWLRIWDYGCRVSHPLGWHVHPGRVCQHTTCVARGQAGAGHPHGALVVRKSGLPVLSSTPSSSGHRGQGAGAGRQQGPWRVSIRALVSSWVHGENGTSFHRLSGGK